ncbi:MAG TPA: DUF1549 domain-containing protein, partial [Planctomycetaceae bacterium]|nr:DUF1549 domain-containing protein [Planctomycetaceae bacterium]
MKSAVRVGTALGLTIVACGEFTPAVCLAETQPVRFNRDIRPILAENCFQCHGPDSGQRKSGLRLDQREAALRPADSGEVAIVPGQPGASALVARIEAEDPALRMPPADSKKQLSPVQKELLKQWIAAGAPFELHWSFVAPERPELPPAPSAGANEVSWSRNPIDRFVLARLVKEGLVPAPEADSVTLLRRLSLDLTGLPPRQADVDAFMREMAEAERVDRAAAADQKGASASCRVTGAESERIYVRWVDRLLGSPHFGERMAVDW